MEFKPQAQPKTKILTVKRLILVIVVLLLGITLFFEVYSPIYINNYEDLDVKAEADRVGGEFYDKDGDKMYFADYKKADATDTILFIHGSGGSSFSWRNNISGFTDKYHVISFDLLGFGMSKMTKSNDIGIDRDVEIISSFIKEKGLKNITLVGHSIGGIVAQKLAMNNPTNIISLILINSLDASNPDNKNSFIKSFINIPLVKNPFMYYSYNSIKSQVEKSYYDHSLIQKLTIEGYQKGFRYKGTSDQLAKYIKSSEPTIEDLGNIKQLTLIYSSENDEIISKENQIKLSKEIPNATLITIKNSGHLLMEEQPLLVNEGIQKWIEETHAKMNMA